MFVPEIVLKEAIKILKPYENFMDPDAQAGSMDIRFAGGKKAPDAMLLSAMQEFGCTHTTLESGQADTDGEPGVYTVIKFHGVNFTTLAEAGINYPGSSSYRIPAIP